MAAPRHVYETFIRATPAEVWAAITRPEFTRRYFHHTSFESELVPGARHRYVLAGGREAVDGVIEEVDEGRRLVMTWHVLYDAAMAEEPPSRVEWVLRPGNADGTVTRLTLRHLDLGASPLTSDNVALGWNGVLDSLKTLLETGQPIGDLTIDDGPAASADEHSDDEHRRMAVAANGRTWALLTGGPTGDGDGQSDDGRGAATRGATDGWVDELSDCAHASAYHWRQAAAPDTPEQPRAVWLLARCHTEAGHVDLALHHARRCRDLTAACAGAADFDRAYAHEALARALALAGRTDEARAERTAAQAVAIADPDDRAVFEGDLAAGPWFALEATPTGTGR
jgi:uncharacterized protein YndB with AHSA1/START domain